MRAPVYLAFVSSAVVATGCVAHTLERTEGFRRVAGALGASVTAPGCAASDAVCLAVRDNVARDSRETCTPDVDDVLVRPMERPTRVVGELAYVGLDPREYAYDLRPGAGGTFEVEVRVQFEGSLARDPRVIAAMQEKLSKAAALWTLHSPGGRTRFRFVAHTTDVQYPHFQVHLAPGDGRTPFDVTWGADWPWHLVAHEIGHMMGLDDEYGQLRKTLGHALGKERAWEADARVKHDWLQCNLASLMCDSKGASSVPQRYHYYVILRRRFCDGALGGPIF